MATYPSISDTDKFKSWIEQFRNIQSFVRPAGSLKKDKDSAIKRPIKETLKAIQDISVRPGLPATLELNLLYACFLASKTPPPDNDIFAQGRLALRLEREQRPEALSAISTLLDYISDNSVIVRVATALTDNPKITIAHQPTPLSVKNFELLQKLLRDLKQGLLELSNPRHPALITSDDFHYGPFEFDFDLNLELKRKGTKKEDLGMHMIHTGLMFHLTYLFRYFTSKIKPPRSAAFFDKDILVLDSVRMIYVGKPYGRLVAALTNAVFKERYSSRDVKDRLDSLYKLTPGSKTKKNPVFTGW
jgi:hypothetical protein